MKKDCKKGYHFCPIAKKCVKTDDKKQGKGLQFGQGKGPLGIPKKKIVEALNYVMETEAYMKKHKVSYFKEQLNYVIEGWFGKSKEDHNKEANDFNNKRDYTYKTQAVKDAYQKHKEVNKKGWELGNRKTSLDKEKGRRSTMRKLKTDYGIPKRRPAPASETTPPKHKVPEKKKQAGLNKPRQHDKIKSDINLNWSRRYSNKNKQKSSQANIDHAHTQQRKSGSNLSNSDQRTIKKKIYGNPDMH